MKHTKPDLNIKRKGDLAEHHAITWLWEQGYEVFKNCGGTGIVDIVAISPENKTVLIDVKTTHCYADGKTMMKKARTPKQTELGVVILGYNPATAECRWIKHYASSNVQQLQLVV